MNQKVKTRIKKSKKKARELNEQLEKILPDIKHRDDVVGIITMRFTKNGKADAITVGLIPPDVAISFFKQIMTTLFLRALIGETSVVTEAELND